MSTISETPDELKARIAISDKAAQGLVEQIDRLREQNAALLLALEKIRAAYTRSTNKFAVQTLDAMDEIAQQAIAAAERKP